MIRTDSLLSDRQRALEERLGLRVLTLGLVQRREVIQARGYIGMIWSYPFIGHIKSLLCYHHRAAVLALLIERHRFVVEHLPLAALRMDGCGNTREQD